MGSITSIGTRPSQTSKWVWEIVTTATGQKKKQLVRKATDDRASK